ncbi:hypothetical protein PED39_02430 [Methanomassiliicoccales archaeon LGM-RCC1]|nr:hypothetical protein PED39_02430 [Methanomassiliicoccales archaeon LGM-RCC1]
MTVPTLGRFRKIFEMSNEMDLFISKLMDVKNTLSNSPSGTKDIVEKLFSNQKKVKCIEKKKLGKKECSEMLSSISNLVEHLRKIKDEMESLSELALEKECLSNETYNPLDWFITDQKLFRREAFWEELILSEDERKILESATIIKCGKDG